MEDVSYQVSKVNKKEQKTQKRNKPILKEKEEVKKPVIKNRTVKKIQKINKK